MSMRHGLFWFHAPLSNFHRNTLGPTSDTVSSSLFTSMAWAHLHRPASMAVNTSFNLRCIFKSTDKCVSEFSIAGRHQYHVYFACAWQISIVHSLHYLVTLLCYAFIVLSKFLWYCTTAWRLILLFYSKSVWLNVICKRRDDWSGNTNCN